MSAEAVIKALRAAGKTISTVESCTGGMVAAALTDVSGSSAVFERGAVTYSNAAKTALAGVDRLIFEHHGAVSEACVIAMAEGGLHAAKSDMAIAISGVAGPTGGSAEKPVGLVWFACAEKGGKTRTLERRYGPQSRGTIRQNAVNDALLLVLRTLRGDPCKTD